MADLVCKNAYFAYQAARSRQDRLDRARHLDSIRWGFYKRWRQARQVDRREPQTDSEKPEAS